MHFVSDLKTEDPRWVSWSCGEKSHDRFENLVCKLSCFLVHWSSFIKTICMFVITAEQLLELDQMKRWALFLNYSLCSSRCECHHNRQNLSTITQSITWSKLEIVSKSKIGRGQVCLFYCLVLFYSEYFNHFFYFRNLAWHLQESDLCTVYCSI